jgi:hypothetical protein
MASVEALGRNLGSLSHEVSTSGPGPFPRQEGYTPKFWVQAFGELNERYEPLVLSWMSHDKTVLTPDPGFLMTYGLVPRAFDDGSIYWDDPRLPIHGVVQATAPSTWNSPSATTARVTISKAHLQDYLSLRQMALVQSFWEHRHAASAPEIEAFLDGEEIRDFDTPRRRLRLGKMRMHGGTAWAEVFSARILARPGSMPISDRYGTGEALEWPGIEGPIDRDQARRFPPFRWVFIDDRVLEHYEGCEGFRVLPESGFVKFGFQWSVSTEGRIGRDTIQVELRKLYEGVPFEVTRHWHKFARPRPAGVTGPEPNVATRAKALTYGVVELGENLAELAGTVGLTEHSEDAFVGLGRDKLDYEGWYSTPQTEAISRHMPANMSRDRFLERAVTLTKLIEGIRPRPLRELCRALGVPDSHAKDFQSLKLLDCIIKMCQISRDTGTRLGRGANTAWVLLSRDGTEPERPIPRFFALYDVRIMGAHTFSDQSKFAAYLKRFEIGEAETVGGFGLAMDRVYDLLIDELGSMNKTIADALFVCKSAPHSDPLNARGISDLECRSASEPRAD